MSLELLAPVRNSSPEPVLRLRFVSASEKDTALTFLRNFAPLPPP